MDGQTPASELILTGLMAVKQAVANRLKKPGATEADDAMNREILSHVEDAYRVADDYFLLFAPKHTNRKNMTLLQGDEARASLRDFGGAAARLDHLLAHMDGTAKGGLSPLFARKVSHDYTEIVRIRDLINDTYVEGKLHIAALEQAGPFLVPPRPEA